MNPLPPETESVGRCVLDAAFEVHTELGPGLLESVYQQCLAHVLIMKGYSVVLEQPVPVKFKGHSIDCGFRADIIVDDLVLVELKAVDEMKPIYTSQILTYLRLTSIQLGFLINFNVIHLKDGIRRFVRPDLLREPTNGAITTPKKANHAGIRFTSAESTHPERSR